MSKITRVAPMFYKDIEESIRKRILSGKDDVFDKKSFARMTEGISRHPMFREKVLPDLVKADMPKGDKDDKKK